MKLIRDEIVDLANDGSSTFKGTRQDWRLSWSISLFYGLDYSIEDSDLILLADQLPQP